MRISRPDIIKHLDQLGVDAEARRRARDELPDHVDTAGDADRLGALGIDVHELERWARARHDDPAPDHHRHSTGENDTEGEGDAGGGSDDAELMEAEWDERDL